MDNKKSKNINELNESQLEATSGGGIYAKDMGNGENWYGVVKDGEFVYQHNSLEQAQAFDQAFDRDGQIGVDLLKQGWKML